MTTRTLDCTVTIGGVDFSNYVVSIHREHYICRPVGVATVELDADNAPDCDPGDSIVITEMGTKRFTGYVSEVSKRRMPATYEVGAQDELKRLVEYQFVDDPIPSEGQTVTYWIEYFLNRCGISSYSVATSTNYIPSTLQFNFESIISIIQKLCMIEGWQIYADADGTVHVGDFMTKGIPTRADNVSRIAKLEDDSWLRNKIVVFGSGDIRAEANPSIPQLGSETRAVVLANPYIPTQAIAQGIADDMQGYFETPLDTREIVIEGGEMVVSLLDNILAVDGYTGKVWGLVTGLESDFDQEGYTVSAFVNERCPSFWGYWETFPEETFDEAVGLIWLSLDGSGIYRYSEIDEMWVDCSIDLSGGALWVREIETDPNDIETAWTATFDGVYKFELGVWEKQTLPNPVNDAGDSPAPTYADLDFQSIEVLSSSYVVATAKQKGTSRGWLYVYDGSWSSYALSDTGSYAVYPLRGPQALYVPTMTMAYLTIRSGSNCKVVKRASGYFSIPYSTSGSPLEITGPLDDANMLYIFGNPDPILLKSTDGGVTQTDIKPAAADPLRPVMPLQATYDDLLVVTSSGIVKSRFFDEWQTQANAPIVPGCGVREKTLGFKALLGQKQAGEPSKVSWTPNMGMNWEDLSEGLPNIRVTSIAQPTTGSYTGPPYSCDDSCKDVIEAWQGKWYRKRMHMDNWPWVYLPDEEWAGAPCPPYVEDSDYVWWWERQWNPWYWDGFFIHHFRFINCEEVDGFYGPGWKFDILVTVHSPHGIAGTGYPHWMIYQQSPTRNDAEEPFIYDDNRTRHRLWDVNAYPPNADGVDILSGNIYGGGACFARITYRPFQGWYAWQEDCLYKSTPWMSFSLLLVSNWLTDTSIPEWDTDNCVWYCGDCTNNDPRIGIGERGYPDYYSTMQAEFAARYNNEWTLGPLAKRCEPCYPPVYGYDGYREAYWGMEVDLPISGADSIANYQYYDKGLLTVHLIGE